jgi:hypothetical protein
MHGFYLQTNNAVATIYMKKSRNHYKKSVESEPDHFLIALSLSQRMVTQLLVAV